jgi:hypothetical protein
MLKFIILLWLLVPLFGCGDDETLPFSEYENVDLNVYFYVMNGNE